jgi:HAE1 family hydrophobic/amphiphilic exporter-1/multidrug efflux pump
VGRFFLARPVFAIVVSLILSIAGLASMLSLPVSMYPQISPPTVEVEINYPGANASTVEAAVASPVESEINGAEGMIYFASKSTSDGRYVLTCTFEVGTDLDLANVDVNNRVQRAAARLPPEAVAYGLAVRKKSPDLLQAITVRAADGGYDDVFLSNWASINLVDAIGRVPGVGSTSMVGQRDYAMRIWLKPDRMTKLGLTATDVAAAIKEQNVLAPAGAIGAPPARDGTEFQLTVDVQGRLVTPEQFGEIVLRAEPDGRLLRLRDVARIELAAKTYSSFGRMGDRPAVIVLVYQLPGANALDVAKGVAAELERIRQGAPPGLELSVDFDYTRFVSSSIEEVVHTLFEAFVLVIVVIFVFLGNARATFIPLLAVPVSLLGTFALFGPLGFSLNTLTLFGLVLAIGIVVDDAIVVVEAVEHHIERGLSPREATAKAIDEVTGPVIATSAVLAAVFIPVAFMGGIVGQLYRQFALTLSVSVVISSIVALSLTPALCGLILRPRKQGRGPVAAFLRGFNRVFAVATGGYLAGAGPFIRKPLLALVAALAFLGGAGWMVRNTPTAFVPNEDQGYFFVAMQLPDGASLMRTEDFSRVAVSRVEDIPGVREVLTLGGLNLLSGSYGSNVTSLLVLLDDWSERTDAERSLRSILTEARTRLAALPEGLTVTFIPPPIPGLGNSGGVTYELQDLGGRTPRELADRANELMAKASERPELASLYSSFRPDVPQVHLEVDREKARVLGIRIDSIFQSLQTFLGGLQVNDFNLFGRTYKVTVQADPEFRAGPESLGEIWVRTADGRMSPITAVVTQGRTTGPDLITRYNNARAVEISANPAAGYTSGQAIAAIEEVAAEVAPPGSGLAGDWTGIAYQEVQAGGSQGAILALGLVFVFLALAALYESWAIPFSVLLGLPLGAFGAFLGVRAFGLANDTYVQVGLVMLIGLAAKNAILIAEFAKAGVDGGKDARTAALDAARLRFRPILMTSFAFILGTVPLMISSGAGAGSRHSLGTAVCIGMTVATMVGVFLIPGLFVLVAPRRPGKPAGPPAADGGHA